MKNDQYQAKNNIHRVPYAANTLGSSETMFENITVEMGIGGGVAAMGLAALGKKIYEKIRPNSRKSENDKTEQREEVFDRKKKLQEILEFTDAPYTYTLPFSEGESWSSRTPTGKKPELLVRYKETLIPAKLVSMMSGIEEYKHDVQLCGTIEEIAKGRLGYEPEENLNRFVCGGPFTNPDTRTLLKGRNITFPYLAERYEIDGKTDPDMIRFACPYNENDEILNIIYGNGDRFTYTKDENAIFLARLKGDIDFDCHRGTIHILFGTSTKSTVKAVELLYKHTETLYNMVKDHKGSHYAYLIKVSGSNEIDFSSRRDITRSLWS